MRIFCGGRNNSFFGLTVSHSVECGTMHYSSLIFYLPLTLVMFLVWTYVSFEYFFKPHIVFVESAVMVRITAI